MEFFDMQNMFGEVVSNDFSDADFSIDYFDFNPGMPDNESSGIYHPGVEAITTGLTQIDPFNDNNKNIDGFQNHTVSVLPPPMMASTPQSAHGDVIESHSSSPFKASTVESYDSKSNINNNPETRAFDVDNSKRQ
ncbi:hypothetical protein NADFUDRAFT_83715 [Nadsonia fulvescens var. elongata DSM 6958]|uniref:Uncharacterized protein n=1 Tax=Nadsonia fulvescens var. elongata DSM 6958 TaxID=857566 RepID=A0A1E3PFF2_9ASCO|nr:hypothetical protein NADFUDRAFT_83715 [Nadsonia fulvescens var. elongata DSM 6958]